MFFTKIAISEKPNKKWRLLFENRALTVAPISIRTNKEAFFCIGSCFAEYVKKSIETQKKIICYPDYRKLDLDLENELADTINSGTYHMNHYSIASIRQEFQRALGIVEESKFNPVKIDGVDIVEGKKTLREGSHLFQDPFRREVFARDEQACKTLSSKINKVVSHGIKTSNIFIITLGLIEVFKNSNGFVFNQFPGYSGKGYNSDDLAFHLMTYQEICEDLLEVISIIRAQNETADIVFSVSPVPLQLTFTSNDIFVANTYSKNLLRAAVNEVIDPSNGVHYFPSYEIANNMGSGFFQDRDLRHAKQKNVDMIMKTFLKAIG